MKYIKIDPTKEIQLDSRGKEILPPGQRRKKKRNIKQRKRDELRRIERLK